MRERKLESIVNQQGKLKQKCVTQKRLKEGLGAFRKLLEYYTNTELLEYYTNTELRINSVKLSEQNSPFF
jgi:hypothetical protein